MRTTTIPIPSLLLTLALGCATEDDPFGPDDGKAIDETGTGFSSETAEAGPEAHGVGALAGVVVEDDSGWDPPLVQEVLTPCAGADSPANVVLELADPSVDAIGAGGTLDVAVGNLIGESAELTLSASIFDPLAGPYTVSDFVHLSFEAGGTARKIVKIPTSALALPKGGSGLAGAITFTVEGTFADGKRVTPETAPTVRLRDEGADVFEVMKADALIESDEDPDFPADEVVSPLVYNGAPQQVSDDNGSGDGGPSDGDGGHKPGIDEIGNDDAKPGMDVEFGLRVDEPAPSHAGGDSQFTTGASVCVTIGTTYIDGGVGEDYWTSTSTQYRPAKGMYAKVYVDGVYKTATYFGDGIGVGPDDGCSAVFLYGDGEYRFKVYTVGKVEGRKIRVKTEAGSYLTTSVYVDVDGYTEVADRTISGNWQRTGTYLAASLALYRNYAELPGSQIIEVRQPTSGSTRWQTNPDQVHISGTAYQKKYAIGHEMGHAYGWYSVSDGSKLGQTDCSFTNQPICADAGLKTQDHSRTSKEWQDCAAGEGWGHFYAADTWNNHNETDCKFSLGHDCEGTTPYANRYMEKTCAIPWVKYGVEWDWFKQWWDMHTDATNATMDDFDNLFEEPTSWRKDNVYAELDDAANNLGGDLEYAWDNKKQVNGIDW